MNSGAVYTDHVTRNKLSSALGVEDSPDRLEAPLVAYCTHHYRHSDAEEWRRKIVAGQLFINNVVTTSPDAPLRENAVLEYRRAAWVEPALPPGFSVASAVLFEDASLLALAKPAGLPVLPGGRFYDHALQRLLRAHRPDLAFLAPVHRLGRGTTGALLFAKSRSSSASLCALFRTRELHKVYLAVLSGHVEQARFTVDVGIGARSVSTTHAAMRQSAHVWVAASSAPAESLTRVKAAVSHVHVLAHSADRTSTLCEVAIETGRPHQIRIHSAASGHPLLGDPLYAPGGGVVPGVVEVDSDEEAEGGHVDEGEGERRAPVPGDCGYALHCWHVRHDGEPRIRLTAPPPASMLSAYSVSEEELRARSVFVQG